MPLIYRDGKEVQWNLLERFRSNFLPLSEKMDGESCKDYLSRREGWKDLKEMMLKKKEQILFLIVSVTIKAFEVILLALIMEVWQRAWEILLKPIIETTLILQKQLLPSHLSKLMRGWQHEL